jgi:nicotinate-nucleotide pyrophosphorylase (carboxylating)
MEDVNSIPLPEVYRAFTATGLVQRALEIARDEDLGEAGDITSASSVPSAQQAQARLVARQNGVIAGLAAMDSLIAVFRGDVQFHANVEDGTRVVAGAVLGILTGRARDVLAMERTALNLVGRLSGIATSTAQFVAAVPAGSRAAIYDTRKTTPGLRVLEKYAVRCGGGRCHRLGLHDAVMLKDNHLAGISVDKLAAFVSAASAKARKDHPGLQFVEVEVDSLEQLQALLRLPPGVIEIVLLDNMSVGQLAQAAAMRDQFAPGLQLEASGGVRLETVEAIARTGVDRISAGALTHSAISLDVALDFATGEP